MASRDTILSMLLDLTSPIGPWVFAGFGSDYQNAAYEDPEHGEKVKEQWSQTVNPVTILPILINIANTPPNTVTDDTHHPIQFETWTHELADLIYRVGQTNTKLFTQLHQTLSPSDPGKQILDEVAVWLREDNASRDRSS